MTAFEGKADLFIQYAFSLQPKDKYIRCFLFFFCNKKSKAVEYFTASVRNPVMFDNIEKETDVP
jgi:hypothetical protein